MKLYSIPNFLSDEECNKIIAHIDEHNAPSRVANDSLISGGVDNTHRTSYTSNLSDDIVPKLKQRIAVELGIDNVKHGEGIQGQRYQPGQYFKPHCDFFSGKSFNSNCLASGNRTHTLMVFLNDDFTGGATNFPTLMKKFEPKKGTAIVWENMTAEGQTIPEALHEGQEVIEGTKYIITSWWRENHHQPAEDGRLWEINYKNKFKTQEDLPYFTEEGFKVVKCPDKAWNIIKESYELLKNSNVRREEHFEGKEGIIKGEGVTSEMFSLDHVPTIRSIIHQELKPLHEEWSNQKLEETFIYGIRSYNKGATLVQHVDRIATHHISAIVIVDKDLDCGCNQTKGVENDWALEIQDPRGNWHSVYAEIGDIILYESAKCSHGRNVPFKGNWFRNFYVHYKLKDWTYVG